MIDYFSIALTHGLIALAVWRLLLRDDLDREGAADETRGGWRARVQRQDGDDG